MRTAHDIIADAISRLPEGDPLREELVATSKRIQRAMAHIVVPRRFLRAARTDGNMDVEKRARDAVGRFIAREVAWCEWTEAYLPEELGGGVDPDKVRCFAFVDVLRT